MRGGWGWGEDPTYSSMFKNRSELPARDLLTLVRPSRKLMGMRELPGMLVDSARGCGARG